MSLTPTYIDFEPGNASHCAAIAEIWNAACTPALMISTRFASFNTAPVTGGRQAGRLALVNAQPAGFVLASLLTGAPTVVAPTQGWVDAIAVTPSAQRQGIGATLLAWAEQWLRAQHCERCQLGASQRPFTPGLPTELETIAFFHQRGYGNDHTVWDVAANLATYQTPATVREIDGIVRPAQPGEEDDLLRFLQREFPGRWRFEFEEFRRDKTGRFSDYMLLWSARGVDGFCQLSFEDSRRPIERFFLDQLPRRWGQLGPIGVSADRRGRGYGAALLDAGLRRLHNNGVNGCVIDWTTLVDLYGKFGFQPYRSYIQLQKSFL